MTKPSLFLPLSIQTTLRLASSSRTLAIGPFTRPGKVYSTVYFFPTAAQLSMCHINAYTPYLKKEKRKGEEKGKRFFAKNKFEQKSQTPGSQEPNLGSWLASKPTCLQLTFSLTLKFISQILSAIPSH